MEKIKARIAEIFKSGIKISDNLNGDHERTIRELEDKEKDIREVVVDLKKKRRHQKQDRAIKVIGLFAVVIGLMFITNAYMGYSINGKVELRATEGEVFIGDNADPNNTYFNIDITNITLPSADCDSSEEHGRLILSQGGDSLRKIYACTDIGWQKVELQ